MPLVSEIAKPELQGAEASKHHDTLRDKFEAAFRNCQLGYLIKYARGRAGE